MYSGRFGGATVCSGLLLVLLLILAVFPAEPPIPAAGPVCPMGWYLFMREVFFLCAASVAAMDIVGRGGISPDCLRVCRMEETLINNRTPFAYKKKMHVTFGELWPCAANSSVLGPLCFSHPFPFAKNNFKKP